MQLEKMKNFIFSKGVDKVNTQEWISPKPSDPGRGLGHALGQAVHIRNHLLIQLGGIALLALKGNLKILSQESNSL